MIHDTFTNPTLSLRHAIGQAHVFSDKRPCPTERGKKRSDVCKGKVLEHVAVEFGTQHAIRLNWFVDTPPAYARLLKREREGVVGKHEPTSHAVIVLVGFQQEVERQHRIVQIVQHGFYAMFGNCFAIRKHESPILGRVHVWLEIAPNILESVGAIHYGLQSVV